MVLHWLTPQRARPVKDLDGVVWPSVVRLVGSLVFADKAAWRKTSTSALSALLLSGAHVGAHDARARDDPFMDGMLCRMLLLDATMRARLPIPLAEHHERLDTELLRRACVAGTLLQLAQHPRLQRMMIRQGRTRGRRPSHPCGDASVLKRVALVCAGATRKECRTMANAALCAVEDELATGVRGNCDLFRED